MKVDTMHSCQAPLFVIGNPRSGTTLLRLILTSHNEILIPPECGFIIWLKEKYGDWTWADCISQTRLTSFINDLFSCRKFDTWELDKGSVRWQIENIRPSNYNELCGAVYAAYGSNTGRYFSRWGDKNNFYLNHLDDLIFLFNDAQFLHIVRDGRDVACSYREVIEKKSSSPYAPNFKKEISDIAHEWTNNVTKIDYFISSIPSGQGLTVKYEDLVFKPMEIIKVICDWLKIKYEPKMLDFYIINRIKNLEPELTIDWKERTMHPISHENVGRYKSYLCEKDLLAFEAIAKHALTRFKYSCCNENPSR